MATTKESLYESIQTTRKRYELLREQEIKDLKDVLRICCGGEWEFDVEEGYCPYCVGYIKYLDEPVDIRIESVKLNDDGELEIYGSPILCGEPDDCEKIYAYKLLFGQIQYITESIFNSWCYIQDTLQV